MNELVGGRQTGGRVFGRASDDVLMMSGCVLLLTFQLNIRRHNRVFAFQLVRFYYLHPCFLSKLRSLAPLFHANEGGDYIFAAAAVTVHFYTHFFGTKSSHKSVHAFDVNSSVRLLCYQ